MQRLPVVGHSHTVHCGHWQLASCLRHPPPQIAFVALLGTVTLEVALVARYWTWLFGVLTVLSYVLVYPYLVIFPLAGRC